MEMKEEKPIKQYSVEDVLPFIGDFGRYQKLLCLMFSVISFPVAMQPTLGYFVTLTPNWECVNATQCPYNGTFADTDTRRCHIPRDSWRYVESEDFSIATQFELHCNQKFLLSLIVSIYFAGWAAGAITIGWVADRYGRRLPITPCVAMTFVLGFISPFVPNIYVLIFLRFLIGFAFPGVVLQVTILITEYVGNDMRPIAKTFPSVAINFSWMVVALKAYLLPNWKYLSIACTAPYVLVLFFHFFIPESARWLHLNNRPADAMKVLHSIAKWNKKEIPSHITLPVSTNITIYKPKSNASVLFKSKSLRLKTLVHTYIWMNIALLSYGLQFAAKSLGGSLYLNYIMLAGVGLPATAQAAFVSRRFGRKASTLGHLLAGSVTCLSIAFIPDKGSIRVLRIVLGIFGRLCGSACFFTIYLWMAEMYPTSIRAVAMGLMQVSARVGSAMSPWVVLELAAFGKWIPFVVIGAVSFLGAGLGCLLPETKGTELEDTVSSVPEKNNKNGVEVHGGRKVSNIFA